MKTAVAIRHVGFEDLGAFARPIEAAGYKIHYYDVGLHELWTLEPVKTDLIIVLGGPIGVYEEDRYPFLRDEISLLEARLEAGRPTMGICLGAQLIARRRRPRLPERGQGDRVQAGDADGPGPAVLPVRLQRRRHDSTLARRHVRSPGRCRAPRVNRSLPEPSVFHRAERRGLSVPPGGDR